ncbi:hypothetical protein VTI74DRAFT_3763 [Chaetomium olivicolor]
MPHTIYPPQGLEESLSVPKNPSQWRLSQGTRLATSIRFPTPGLCRSTTAQKRIPTTITLPKIPSSPRYRAVTYHIPRAIPTRTL